MRAFLSGALMFLAMIAYAILVGYTWDWFVAPLTGLPFMTNWVTILVGGILVLIIDSRSNPKDDSSYQYGLYGGHIFIALCLLGLAAALRAVLASGLG